MRAMWIAALVLALSACAHGSVMASLPGGCISDADRAWVERSVVAWRYSAREITGIGRVHGFQAVFFDADCVLTSPDVLTTGDVGRVAWRAMPHSGTIVLPDGDAIGAGVASFTHANGAGAYFVMSTPSVWRAGGVDNAGLGLETMMVAVLLHEGSHVAQSATYGARVEALAVRNHLGDDFGDDSLQHRFGENAAFALSVAQETDLFFQAAAAADRETARRLARQARDAMKARAARWYVGRDVYWGEAEDLWLTFEGAGQWAGYEWLIDPSGANAGVDVAMANFGRRTRWWSQNEGLAVFLALDRICGHGWRRHVFGDGALTVLQLLDAALA